MSVFIAQLRSEATKCSRTSVLVLVGLIGLVALAIGLHAFAPSVTALSDDDQQRAILVDVTSNLGSAFAGLLGALMITAEFRTGTIRPTLLAVPRRQRVFGAKAGLALGLGALAGILATGTATGVVVLGLGVRDITVQLTTGDIAQLIIGGAVGGALWGIIGLAIGAIVRTQVPTVVGIFAWILFVENILTDLPTIHRYAPAALVQALTGQPRGGVLTSVTLAGLLLAAYTSIVAGAGATRFQRQDVA